MLSNKICRLCLLFTVLIFFAYQNSYSQNDDAGLWTGVTFNIDISEKLGLSFEEEIRFNNNASKINKFFSQIGLSYNLSKNIDIGASYRFINKQNPDSKYSVRHRFQTDLRLKTKAGRYTLSTRIRYQTKYIDPYNTEDGLIPEDYLRNKFAISYDIRKTTLTPYISYEYFYQANNPGGNEIDKTWLTMGFKFRLKNRDRISMLYRNSQQYNVRDPLTSHIFIIAYSTKLNRKAKP